MTVAIDKGLSAILILTLLVLALRLLGQGMRVYSERSESARPVGGIVERIGQVVIVAVAGLMLLSTLFPGVNITPLLTGLGVAGLATALALQDTLANFFAGLYLLADRPVRVGDYAKVTDGNEGYVLDVGWRSTRIRTLQNNVVVIPNQKLAQSVVINYHLPEPRLSLPIPVKVAYEMPPEQVEQALLAVATAAIGEVEGLLSEPEPSVRLIPGFGEWGLEFTLVVQVREFVDQFYVQHELRKRILARFREEGIELSLPGRSLKLAEMLRGAEDGPGRPRGGG
jgi:small-conductance mechanosensitive channel